MLCLRFSFLDSPDDVDVYIFGQSPKYNVPTQHLLYKCDYCSATCRNNRAALKAHLQSSNHPSGSVYLARIAGSRVELVSIYSMKVECLDGGDASAFCVVCAWCGYVTSCILTAALHYDYVHQKRNAVLKIAEKRNITETNVTFSTLSVCPCCQAAYTKRAGINTHWRNYPSHAPEYALLKGRKVPFTATCPMCNAPFQNSIRDLRLHVIQEHLHAVREHRVSAHVVIVDDLSEVFSDATPISLATRIALTMTAGTSACPKEMVSLF